jgi:hypothetical protein
MSRHKKFKTVSGYLRSNEYRILSKLPTDNDPEDNRRRRVAAVQAGQREVINYLLPQIGITDRIADAETPRDGVARLIAVDGKTEQQADALRACDRWLKNFVIPLWSKLVGVNSGPPVEGGAS